MNDKNGPKHVVIEGGGLRRAGLGLPRGQPGQGVGQENFCSLPPSRWGYYGLVPEQVVA